MEVRIEESWKQRLQAEFEQPWWATLAAFVKEEYARDRASRPVKRSSGHSTWRRSSRSRW